MIFTTVFIFLAVFLAILCSFWAIYCYVKPKIIGIVTDFISSPREGVASPFALVVENASKLAGRTIAMEVKAILMNRASVSSRQESGIIADLATDAINAKSPMIGAFLDMVPTLKKRLTKNPALMESLIGMIAKSNGNHSAAAVIQGGQNVA
jgi:hypothetical protein